MQIFQDKQIHFELSFLFWSAVCVLIIPLEWLFSWIIAVTIHELSHYLILKLCRVQIYAISITSSGAIIETEPMPVYKEIISALAGPLGGLCVLSLARYFPVVAICAFFQSIFNLLPIYPLDGGRALHCCFLKMLGEERGSVSFIRFQKYFTFFIDHCFVYYKIAYSDGIGGNFAFKAQTIKISLQRRKTNSTIVAACNICYQTREEYMIDDRIATKSASHSTKACPIYGR